MKYSSVSHVVPLPQPAVMYHTTPFTSATLLCVITPTGRQQQRLKQNNGHGILTKICIAERWPFVRFQDGDPSAILDSLGLQINATVQTFTSVALFKLVWNSLLDWVEHLLRTWSCSRDTSACGALGNTQLLATVKLCWITYCSRPVTIHREAETRNQFSFVCFFMLDRNWWILSHTLQQVQAIIQYI